MHEKANAMKIRRMHFKIKHKHNSLGRDQIRTQSAHEGILECMLCTSTDARRQNKRQETKSSRISHQFGPHVFVHAVSLRVHPVSSASQCEQCILTH